ncbi:MAG TPA: hypothetical protein VK432_03200 [Stellaceae bacterium]|nr:hypothetical protein [Stellaceae bacterium]
MRSGVAAACVVAALTGILGGAAAQAGAPGSSVANAIVLSGVQNELDGVSAEYAYIRDHLPGCQPTQQALIRDGARSYDSIKLTGSGCATQVVFFDITDWFGK